MTEYLLPPDLEGPPGKRYLKRMFVLEYLLDLNAVAAARRAGYKNPRRAAGYLMKDPVITRMIGEAMARRADRLEITADRVLQELARLGFSNIGDYLEVDEEARHPTFNLKNMTRGQAAALQEVIIEEFKGGRGADAPTVQRVKVKLYDKRQALVDIGRHIGMFRDRLAVTVQKPMDFSKLSDQELAVMMALLEKTGPDSRGEGQQAALPEPETDDVSDDEGSYDPGGDGPGGAED